MKNLYITIILLASGCILAEKQPKKPAEKKTTSVSFTENKGQVQDQFNHARPDVLFNGTTGSASFYIKRTGISYQFCKRTSAVTDPMRANEEIAKPEQGIIYRFDQNWVNTNVNSTIETEHVLPGSNNYYYEHCPNGALNVKSYTGIWLKNIYDNISVHYYEKNGVLKYDYEVASHGDYKKIQIDVKGADVVIKDNGGLLIKTPFGDIEEGKPLVYQNGKQLNAKWLVKNNCLSFYIEQYNPSLPLTIDPVVRSWGTYYGGTTAEEVYSVTTDPSGNVYMSGATSSNPGTVIATTGAHQTTFGGAGYYDAFLAKFDATGARLWGTYYGGSLADQGFSCATDANGNVYLAGQTSSSVTGVMATTGTYQSTHGSNGTYPNAFLAKFNGNGVRLWGTYYGGTGQVWAYGCATDASGNVFLSGTSSSSNGSSFATTGAYQSTVTGTNNELYLAKFNTNGTRLWGTYYGSSGTETRGTCATDPLGNVYLCGTTDGTGAFATAGAHQAGSAGNRECILAKFNTTGSRLWATYYGGTGADFGYDCTTDVYGNVYMTGQTTSTVGIATSGSQQATLSGNYDAYVVKLNSTGVRQWATYYGSTYDEYGTTVAVDALSNVYLVGITSSSTAIATSGSHQTTYGGGTADGYLAKFNLNGVRQWGSYYGGTANDEIHSCAVGLLGEIYTVGLTSSNTDIASSGAFQTARAGGSDGHLERFTDCTGPPTQPLAIDGKTNVCLAEINTYSVSPTADGIFYSWSLPSGSTGSSTSNTISITSGANSGMVDVTVSNACGTTSVISLSVTVNAAPAPTITVGSGSVCAGSSFTLVAGGASTYTYSSGSPVVAPVLTSTYTVMGTNAAGCVSAFPATATVVVNTLPVITATGIGVVCSGNSYTITPSGASSYTYSGGSNVVSPTANATYTISGANSNGCVGTATVSVLVFTCVGMDELSGNDLISITPNPSSGYFKISGTGINGIEVYDNLGKVVLKKAGSLTDEIDLSDYPNGLYLIVIQTDDQKLIRKIIKQ